MTNVERPCNSLINRDSSCCGSCPSLNSSPSSSDSPSPYSRRQRGQCDQYGQIIYVFISQQEVETVFLRQTVRPLSLNLPLLPLGERDQFDHYGQISQSDIVMGALGLGPRWSDNKLTGIIFPCYRMRVRVIQGLFYSQLFFQMVNQKTLGMCDVKIIG